MRPCSETAKADVRRVSPTQLLLLTAVTTAHIHPPRWAGFAIGGCQGVVGQPHGAALAVEFVHIAEGADVANLRHLTLGVGGLAEQGSAQGSGGQQSGGEQSG